MIHLHHKCDSMPDRGIERVKAMIPISTAFFKHHGAVLMGKRCCHYYSDEACTNEIKSEFGAVLMLPHNKKMNRRYRKLDRNLSRYYNSGKKRGYVITTELITRFIEMTNCRFNKH